MSSEPIKVKTTESRTRTPLGRRRRESRGSTVPRRAILDAMVLEARTLMTTIPASQFSGTVLIPGTQTGTGNTSSPSIAIDPNNPQKLVSAWTLNDPTFAPGQTEVARVSFSSDGGATWTNPQSPGGFLIDPSSGTSPVPFQQAFNTSVGFDRNDNAYVLYEQSNASAATAAPANGALLVSKYNFSSSTAVSSLSNSVVYEWNGSDGALFPTMAVDNTVSTFTDVGADGVTRVQSNPNSGNVYVAWETNDTIPARQANNAANFNQNRIKLATSSDGAQSFSSPLTMNTSNNNFAGGRETTPSITISQGRAAGTNGPTDPGVKPGTVSVAWDDYVTGATAAPPYDVIRTNTVTSGTFSTTVTNQGGPIQDAIKGANNAPDSPVSTDFPVTVNISDPRFISLSHLQVSVSLTHPAVSELSIQLVPPTGSGLSPITLVQNQTDAAGVTNTGVGVSGANLGVSSTFAPIGTVFDDQATRNIFDPSTAAPVTNANAAPYVGHFQAENGSLDATYGGAIAGAANAPNSVNGTWTLRITDFRNSNLTTPPFPAVVNWKLILTSGAIANSDAPVTLSFVRGQQGGGQTASAASPLGIAPMPVLASDNTLGAYSPHSGRIYLAYVDRSVATLNPTYNTDIFLAFSDDGGLTWTTSTTPVNDDNAVKDGYTGAGYLTTQLGNQITGRAQFQPSITVDQATGTLVMSWLDTRDDAANARVATYTTTSIDGGQTFSPDVYANDPQTATDAITNKIVNLAPILDNAKIEPTLGFGYHQGLAAYGGHLYPIWSSNDNGGNFSGPPNHLGIVVNTGTYAAGPRVISVSSGPIGGPNDTVNTSVAADGTPIASAFKVVFDRYIDPTSFTTNDVQVKYTDTTVGNLTGGFVPITSVVPLDNGIHGATTFLVNFAPRTGVGTYSLAILPNNIHDFIRSARVAVTPTGPAVNLVSSNIPVQVPPRSFGTSNLVVSGYPANQTIDNLTVNLSITSPDASSLFISLVAPDGTTVTLARFEPFFFAGGQNYTNTTFDDNAATPINQGTAPFTGTFKPVGLLSSLKSHGINGTWSLQVRSISNTLTSTITGWSIGLTAGTTSVVTTPGNLMDQNANGTPGEASDFFASPAPVATNVPYSPFVGPFQAGTLPLILPGPHIASTSLDLSGVAPSVDNLSIDKPVSYIDVTFDRNMDPTTITPASVLRIAGPLGSITGPFTVTANPLGTDPDPLHPLTYRIGFPTQKISGTYTVTLAATATDSHGNALDTSLNAGVDLLKGTVSGPTAPVQYNANVTNGTITGGQTLVSTLNITDNYLVSGLTIQLNITDNNDPNLQITLVSPNNIPIILVPRGTGTSGTKSNFTSTIFDDFATSLIQNGAPPFFGRFKPLQPLSGFNGIASQGTWKLIVDDDPTNPNPTPGKLNSWSITLQKGVPSSGLGDPVADQATATFRIFNTGVTNPLASSTWTAVGPASVVDATAAAGSTNGFAGRIDAIAVDPSDPTGNTVYVGASSGGIWKTTNFLTTSPQGPTYIPLTDFGPTSAVNIGSIAVFPRNNDPRQSIIVAGTGDPNAPNFQSNTNTGVGFLISKDGGATWSLSGSSTFAPAGGTSVYKVVVDPRPTATGQVIIYAAVGDNSPNPGSVVASRNGLWRSDDSGATWTRYNSGVGPNDAPATDIILDYNSATIDAVSNPTGNVNTIYVAYPGNGIYSSANRGNALNRMAGGNVLPLIWDTLGGNALNQVPVNNGGGPSGATVAAGGRITLAKPALLPSNAPNASVDNILYAGWLYAAVVQTDGSTRVYMTKDYGQTWTELSLNGLVPLNVIPHPAVPTNDYTAPQYNNGTSPVFSHPAHDISLAVDALNPSILYLGGTLNDNQAGMIRIDTTRTYDSHAFVSYDATRPDGGNYQIATTGRSVVNDPVYGPSGFVGTSGALGTGVLVNGFQPYINLIQDPTTPFATNATLFVHNVLQETNDGTGTRWIPFDQMLQANGTSIVSSTNPHTILSMVDPINGSTRLIVGDDQGVFTASFNPDGTINPGVNAGVGTAASATYSRNGNLQIAQLLYGAAQPSSTLLGTQITSALYLSNGYNLGQSGSDVNVLSNGNITGVGSTNGSPLGLVSVTSADQMGTGVAVDQQGNNTVYRYYWPAFGGNATDFFQVSTNGGPFISRTFGLVQTANDPQWPGESPNYGNGLTFGNFTVSPLNGNQIIISSAAGRIFSTINQGKNWSVIGEPNNGQLDGSYAPALTFGAPDPTAPGGIGNLNNFVYAGTVNGNIFVTRNGGGAWANTGNLDGSPVMKIVADPTRGSHDAYAVTQKGVYYNSNTVGGGTWVNVSGGLFSINNNTTYAGSLTAPYLNYLTSIAADWRYAVPNAAVNGVSTGTHPVLYVSGNAGVFRSLDNGATWSLYPSQVIDGAPADGGYLPNAQVTDLTLSLGKIDPTTGFPIAVPGDPDTLLATTFGRGQFSIRVAPVVTPSSVVLDPNLPAPNGSIGGTDPATGLTIVKIAQPYFDGISEATSIGNRVRITLLDLTDPANPKIIGGYDPSNPATDIAANWTDASGKFAVQVNANGFTTNGTKTVGIRATDLAGVVSNPIPITFILNAKLTSQGQPPAVPTILLNPLDDTSGGKNITSVTNPRIIGVTDPSVQVQLFNASNLQVPLATGTTDVSGNYSLQYPTSPAGTYSVVVIATNSKGSTDSTTLTFTIKTSAPTTVPTLLLDPNDDTGIKGDNTTTVRFPHFIGVTDPGNIVSIFSVVNGARGPVLGKTTADASGNYSIQLPSALADGMATLEVGITDVAGNVGPYSNPLTVTIVTTSADYNGNGTTDPALFRRTTTSSALWLIQGVGPTSGIQYGASNLDIPFTGDFNGAGKADLAVYRPSTNTWYISLPSGQQSYVLGAPGSVPVVGHFDGINVTETAAYMPSTGVWTIASSVGSTHTVTFPAGSFTPNVNDIPVPGNYEGSASGIDDLAVYRPSTNQFIINESTGVVTITLKTGTAGDIPVPGNYDDSLTVHQTLPSVYNPTTGAWLIHGIAGDRTVQFTPGDIPAPGDYTGSGVTQTVVFRPTGTAAFYGPNNTTIVQAIGLNGDIPVTAPLVYRSIVSNTPTLSLVPSSDTGIVGDLITSARQPVFTGTTDPNTLVDLLGTTGNVLNTVTSDSKGVFTVAPASPLKNGSYVFQARAHGSVTNTGPVSPPVGVTLTTVVGDYTGTGKTSVSVFRRTGPYLMQWFVAGYSPLAADNFGAGSLDVPVSGDFNGDGKTDPAVYRPSTAQWYYQDSSNGYKSVLLATFGWAGVDIPVPGDYSGAGVSVPAVYRPTTGEWFVSGSASSTIVTSAQAGDVPVPGNYDNTGKTEFAIFRPSTGQWYINGPNGTYTVTLGQAGDIPVPGAYDATATNHSTEVAIFRPSTGQYIIHTSQGNRTIQFKAGDIPAPGDYEGTGVTEAAVFRNSTAAWYVANATDTAPRLLTSSFGWAGHDVPPNTPYVYRALKGSGTVTAASIAPPIVIAGPAGTTSGVTTNGSTGTTNGLTPAPASSPTSVNIHSRQRPAQSHAEIVHGASLTKHPLLAVNRIPSITTKNGKKG